MSVFTLNTMLMEKDLTLSRNHFPGTRGKFCLGFIAFNHMLHQTDVHLNGVFSMEATCTVSN